MKDFIFNSLDMTFRNPCGAIPEKSKIKFTIYIARSVNLKDVSLAVQFDNDSTTVNYHMDWCGFECGYDQYSVTVHFGDVGLYWYYFEICTFYSNFIIGRDENYETKMYTQNPHSWQISVYSHDFKTPDWIKGGIFYHIFVDRFNKSGNVTCKSTGWMHPNWSDEPDFLPNAKGEILNNDFFGGNIKGIIEKLDYLKSMNVSCIYLSPIFEAYSSHKYDTGDYSKIDSMFGDIDDFKELCEKANSLDIRVICDGVFNHVGSNSLYFNRCGEYQSLGAYQSKESPYFKWFNFKKHPDKYACWWDFQTLPAVNKDEPSYVEFVNGKNGIIRKWLKCGASGWRLDVADELPNEFLEKLRDSAKSEKSDALIIGEVWEDASNKIAYDKRRKYFQGHQLDSVMNYPLQTAIIQFVRNKDSALLENTVREIIENYPKQVVDCLMNVLGTHDTPRILTALVGKDLPNATRQEKHDTKLDCNTMKHGKNLLRLASLLQFTLPGVPCIYYGDEAGIEGYNDPFNRKTFPWGNEDTELIEWYKKISEIRTNNPIFKQGCYRCLLAKDGVFVFERFNNLEKITIGINRSETPFEIQLTNESINLISGKKISGKIVIDQDNFLIIKTMCI